MSGDSFSRLPRPWRTTLMNCWCIWASICCACSLCDSMIGENGSRNPLFSPADSSRRYTPSFSSVPVKPKPSISTPIEPMMLALSM